MSRASTRPLPPPEDQVGLDPETAEADAEGLEHHASEKALAGFARFIKAQEGGGR